MSRCLPIKMVLHKDSIPAQIIHFSSHHSILQKPVVSQWFLFCTNLLISAQNIHPTIYDKKAETIQATPNRESYETNLHQSALSPNLWLVLQGNHKQRRYIGALTRSFSVVTWTPVAGGVGPAPSLHKGYYALGDRSAERWRGPPCPSGEDVMKVGIRDTGGGVGTDGLRTELRGVDFYLPQCFSHACREKCHERFHAYGKPWNRGHVYFPRFWVETKGI
jgi:hypothetical protein